MTARPHLAVCVSLLLSSAASAQDWQPVQITSFLKEASTWMPNCSGKDGGRIFIAPGDIGGITDAALDEDLSCVKFNFRGKPYFVRETVVEQVGAAKRSSVGACQYDGARKSLRGMTKLGAISSSGSSHEATTMGAGETVQCGQH
ncbi:MAG TPA: hypothetical protein VG889_15145 [Rhizomicrobium sp.]|nr:hypothetical protein [Rhizomicrobium sp.]